MGMSFLGIKKEKDKFFLALDIGTETIKALIFSPSPYLTEANEKRGGGKTIIWGASLQYFKWDELFDSSVFKRESLKKTILEATQKAQQKLFFSQLQKDLKGKIQKQKKWQVLLTLPPNLFKGRIVRQSFFREKPNEKISKTEEKEISGHIFREAQREISQEFTNEFGILPGDIHWVSLQVLETEIDGYVVSSFEGYKGREIKLKILISFLPKNYFDEIKRVIESQDFEILKVMHLAEAFLIYGENKERDGIFLDIGGEVTQIFLVRNGKLQEINEFQGGGKVFTESLSQTLGLDEETARQIEENYSKGLLSGETTERVKEIFLPELKAWYENLKTKLKKTKSAGLTPSNFFLFGGGSLFPEIQKKLKEKLTNNAKDLPIQGLLKVEPIYPRDLKNIEDPTKSLNGPQEVPLLLITSAFLKINNKD